MKKQLDTKDLLEFKFSLVDDDAERGVFKGLASVFGVVDSYGDIVVPGAFRKTLKDTNPVPMLWNHSVDQPIGVVHLVESEKGLEAVGHLNMDVAKAQETRSLMKQGAVNGLSIGYQTARDDVDKDTGTRVLKEIKLWEISPVVFQACPGALIEGVKDASLEETATEAEPEKSTQPSDSDIIHSLENWIAAIEAKRKEITGENN